MKQCPARSTLDEDTIISKLSNHHHGRSRNKGRRQLNVETLDSKSNEQEVVSPKKHQPQLLFRSYVNARRARVISVSSVSILALFLFLLNVSNLQNPNGYFDYIKEDHSSNVVAPSTSAHQDQAQRNEENEQQATDNRAPDFGIIGFPKTGTTFLLDALNRHSEVVMPVPSRADNREFCKLEDWFEDMKNISSPPQSPHQTPTPTRYGFKCPTIIKATKGIEDLVKIAKDKDTRLVMGLRHPVLG